MSTTASLTFPSGERLGYLPQLSKLDLEFAKESE